MLERFAVSVEIGDEDPCSSKNTGVIAVLQTSEAPVNGHARIRASSPKNKFGSVTQLEVNLVTAMKENKNCFYKYISNKRRPKENFHTLLDVEGNSDKELMPGKV